MPRRHNNLRTYHSSGLAIRRPKSKARKRMLKLQMPHRKYSRWTADAKSCILSSIGLETPLIWLTNRLVGRLQAFPLQHFPREYSRRPPMTRRPAAPIASPTFASGASGQTQDCGAIFEPVTRLAIDQADPAQQKS